jgi:hypothetical protein
VYTPHKQKTLTSRSFLHRRSREQSTDAAITAETTGSKSIADIIHQLRARARKANRRSTVFLVLLFITVVGALGYYVFTPIYYEGQASSRRALETRKALLVEEIAKMDAARNIIWQDIITQLDFTGTAIPSGTDETLYALSTLPDGKTLVAVGWRGTVTRSTDGGDTWQPRTSGTDQSLRALSTLPDGKTLVAVGEYGAIIKIDDRYAPILLKTAITSGSPGDVAMKDAFATLPAYLRTSAVLITPKSQFDTIIAGRDLLADAIATAERAISEIKSGGFSLQQRREDFAAFMATCRTAETETQHCTAAYTAIRESERKSLWETVASHTPKAVLILFLLATLGGLYRYNLRLAGFHASRADVLELAEIKRIKDPKILADLATAFAADKVEFGKSATTPADQAIAMAQAITKSRSPPFTLCKNIRGGAAGGGRRGPSLHPSHYRSFNPYHLNANGNPHRLTPANGYRSNGARNPSGIGSP